jgi:chemotaxis response regulator CheB
MKTSQSTGALRLRLKPAATPSEAQRRPAAADRRRWQRRSRMATSAACIGRGNVRDNVGILEISSAMMRDLLHDACAPLGRISVYRDVAAARRALETLPPKVLVCGGAPLDAEALALLCDAVEKHSVIALALVDRHDFTAAMNAGASDGFPRNAEGLRQLKLRLRPLLGSSLRPPADDRAIVTWSSRAPAGTPSAPVTRASVSPPSAAGSRCNVIVLGAEAQAVDGVAYLLSRLATTAPGIVLQTHGGADAGVFVERLRQESPWRVQEAAAGVAITAGCVWVAPRAHQLRVGQGPEGVMITSARTSAAVSCDVLFESAAQEAARTALGVLLASPSGDGVRGLRALREAGGYTLIQRVGNAPSMPASNSGIAHECVALSELPQTIAAFCSARAAGRHF